MLNKLASFVIKLIFAVAFFLIITPLGLVLRAFSIDFLDRKISSEMDSYWKKHR